MAPPIRIHPLQKTQSSPLLKDVRHGATFTKVYGPSFTKSSKRTWLHHHKRTWLYYFKKIRAIVSLSMINFE